MTHQNSNGISRRTLLRTGTVAAGTMAFAPSILRADGHRVRKNMMHEGGKKDLDTYRKAVGIMLDLPLDDPRNWYRNAFVHFIDCPHGNWWFTSWHRGYLGYFEEIIREVTGEEDFMLPYWDWTKNNYVPPSMFGADNALDPVNYAPATGGYIKTLAEFKATVREPMLEYWNALTPDQRAEQDKRKNFDFEIMWATKHEDNAVDSFQEQKHARFLTAENPDLDANTQPLVALDNVLGDLAPTEFSGDFKSKRSPYFENSVTGSHHDPGHFSGLSNTHNLVHNCTGGSFDKDDNYVAPYGIMTQNLSPLDPIFFLHHGNIDRLWDVWTRKQIARGHSIQPGPKEIEAYKNEPYLFFVDRHGDPVTDRTTSWDFFSMESFDYTYEPASGEIIVPPESRMTMNTNVATAMVAKDAGLPRADFLASAALVDTASRSNADSRHLATVTFVPPADARGKVFLLYISPQGEAPILGKDSPELAGRFSFFGHPHGAETGFTVSIDGALDRMIEAGILTEGAPLSFSLVMSGSTEEIAANVDVNGQLQSVEVHVLSGN